jgi:hypothetical protein
VVHGRARPKSDALRLCAASGFGEDRIRYLVHSDVGRRTGPQTLHWRVRRLLIYDDHASEIDADAQFDGAARRDAYVPLGHRLLYLNRAAQCVDNTPGLDEHAVAGGLHYPAAMFTGFRVDQFTPMRLQPRKCPFLVGAPRARRNKNVR